MKKFYLFILIMIKGIFQKILLRKLIGNFP